MHSTNTTNLSLIIQNLVPHLDDGREKVVLLKTGSLNPIHRGHILNLVRVKEYLEREKNLHVVGGFISPTHDSYVRRKLDKQFTPGHHRAQMCVLAIQEAEQTHWLSVDQAEMKMSNFVPAADILLSLQNYINSNVSFGPRIRVIYVAGLDHFNQFQAMKRLRKHPWGGVAVVYRSGEPETHVQDPSSDQDKLYYVEDHVRKTDTFPTNEISSTKIRELLKAEKPCHELTYLSVIVYIKSNGL